MQFFWQKSFVSFEIMFFRVFFFFFSWKGKSPPPHPWEKKKTLNLPQAMRKRPFKQQPSLVSIIISTKMAIFLIFQQNHLLPFFILRFVRTKKIPDERTTEYSVNIWKPTLIWKSSSSLKVYFWGGGVKWNLGANISLQQQHQLKKIDSCSLL